MMIRIQTVIISPYDDNIWPTYVYVYFQLFIHVKINCHSRFLPLKIHLDCKRGPLAHFFQRVPALYQTLNSAACRMLHACLHTVTFSKITFSKYHTVVVGLSL